MLESANKTIYINKAEITTNIYTIHNNSNNEPQLEENALFCTDELSLSHPTGSSWKFDECTSCVCKPDGTTKCFTETCDVLQKCDQSILIKGKCCPICSRLFFLIICTLI